MKKILLILTILLLPALQVYSQYSLPIRLVSSTGTPLTGQAGNIEFTRYPHSYPGDVVSGITVTEVGTAGNYVAKGFTTWEYVKLWISGTNATWFDSVQVGDITAYITTRLGSYVTLSTGQTVSGIKTFSSTTYLGGLVQQTGNYNFEMYKPQLHASSPWATYLTLTSLALIPKYIGDSDYVPKTWMYYGGSGDIRLQSGYKLYGRTNSTSPIGINTAHFGYADDKISLLYPVNFDSVTIKKDTLISEITYSKLWSLKRRFWSQRDSLDLYWMYKNTYAGTQDSFAVINKAHYLADVNSKNAVDNADWENITALTFPAPGTYAVTVTFEYEFSYVTPTNTVYDSLNIGVYNGAPSEEDPADTYTYRFAYNNGVPNGFQGTGTLQFVRRVTSATLSALALYAKASKTVTVTLSDNNVYIKRYKIQAIRIN